MIFTIKLADLLVREEIKTRVCFAQDRYGYN